MAGVSATGELVNRSKGVVETQTVQAVSLLNGEGLVYMLTHAITNFTASLVIPQRSGSRVPINKFAEKLVFHDGVYLPDHNLRYYHH